jgi:hypothetical protein
LDRRFALIAFGHVNQIVTEYASECPLPPFRDLTRLFQACELLQVVALVNPLRHYIELLRGAYLKNVGVHELLPNPMQWR